MSTVVGRLSKNKIVKDMQGGKHIYKKKKINLKQPQQ